jgi:predicted transcriptional regulator
MINTKLEAYFEMCESGKMGTQEKTVFNYIIKHPGCTRRQIKDNCRLEINAVCGRVKKLIDEGKVCVIGTCGDPITKKNVEMLGSSVPFGGYGNEKIRI